MRIATHTISFFTTLTMTASTLCAQGRVEDFESFSVADGSAVTFTSAQTTLNSSTVLNGQGPGLVESGCTYVASGICANNGLAWNGANYFGLPSRCIYANCENGVIEWTYSRAQCRVVFELLAFAGFSDTVTVTSYDSTDSVIEVQASILVGGGASIATVELYGPDIKRVVVDGDLPWSPMIDNHEYGSIPGTGCSGAVIDCDSAPSSTQPFSLTSTTISGCTGPVAVLFGACAVAPIPVEPPIACSSCGFAVVPTWGSASSPFNVPAGLPIGFEFCVQSGCIATDCIKLSRASRIVIGP